MSSNKNGIKQMKNSKHMKWRSSGYNSRLMNSIQNWMPMKKYWWKKRWIIIRCQYWTPNCRNKYMLRVKKLWSMSIRLLIWNNHSFHNNPWSIKTIESNLTLIILAHRLIKRALLLMNSMSYRMTREQSKQQIKIGSMTWNLSRNSLSTTSKHKRVRSRTSGNRIEHSQLSLKFRG